MVAGQLTTSASSPSPLNHGIAASQRDGEVEYPLSEILKLRDAKIDWIDIAKLLGFDYTSLYYWAQDKGLEQRRFPPDHPRSSYSRRKQTLIEERIGRAPPPACPSRLDAAIAAKHESEVSLDRQPVRGLKPPPKPQLAMTAAKPKPGRPGLNKTATPQPRAIPVVPSKAAPPPPQPRRIGTPDLIFIPADLADMMAARVRDESQQEKNSAQRSGQANDLTRDAAREPGCGSALATQIGPADNVPGVSPSGKQRAQRAPELPDMGARMNKLSQPPSRLYRF